jgi:hypothetical protein
MPKIQAIPLWVAIAMLHPAIGSAQLSAPPTKPGFPLNLGIQGPDCTALGDGGNTNQANNACANASTNVLVADLGLSPGYLSIAFGTGSGRVFVLYRDPADGVWKVAPGWPHTLPSHAVSTPARADLNGDGRQDLVLGFGSTFAGNTTPGGVRALRNDGTTLWTYTTGDIIDQFDGPDAVVSSPAIADIDGDGHQEVVFSGFDHSLHVVDGRTGVAKPGWPKMFCDTSFSSPALYDIDGDGLRDILIGSDSAIGGDTVGGYVCSGTEDVKGHLWAFRWNGTLLPGFPKQFTDQIIQSSPVVGDIDGDGDPEIVHGTGSFYSGDTPRLYAWELDGTAVSGWPVNTTTIGRILGSPALADLNGDGVPEVVVTAVKTVGSLHYVAAYYGNGSQVFQQEVRDFFGNSLSAGDPMVGDVFDGGANDDDPEILVPTNTEVAVFSATGARLTEIDNFPDDPLVPNLFGQFSVNNVAVADLESGASDGKIEIIMVSADPFPQATSTVVHVWTPVERATQPQWGQFRHDPRHLGVDADCDVVLENQAVPGFLEVESCDRIRVEDVTVTGSGDLVLVAPDSVVLGASGTAFSVESGGTVRVRTG